jgi:hypothetical protein
LIGREGFNNITDLINRTSHVLFLRVFNEGLPLEKRDNPSNKTSAIKPEEPSAIFPRNNSNNSLHHLGVSSWKQLGANSWQQRWLSSWQQRRGSGQPRKEDSLVCTSRPLDVEKDPLFPDDLFTKDQLRECDFHDSTSEHIYFFIILQHP